MWTNSNIEKNQNLYETVENGESKDIIKNDSEQGAKNTKHDNTNHNNQHYGDVEIEEVRNSYHVKDRKRIKNYKVQYKKSTIYNNEDGDYNDLLHNYDDYIYNDNIFDSGDDFENTEYQSESFNNEVYDLKYFDNNKKNIYYEETSSEFDQETKSSYLISNSTIDQKDYQTKNLNNRNEEKKDIDYDFLENKNMITKYNSGHNTIISPNKNYYEYNNYREYKNHDSDDNSDDNSEYYDHFPRTPKKEFKTELQYLFEIVTRELEILENDLQNKRESSNSDSIYISESLKNKTLKSRKAEILSFDNSEDSFRKKRGRKRKFYTLEELEPKDFITYKDENNDEKRFPLKIVNGKKIYICPVPTCTRNFPSKSRMKRHYIVHTDEKPFKCLNQYCEKSFSRKDNMLQHYKSHCSLKKRDSSLIN
ncbi:Zinc finger C2H2 protein [Dictyocoela muelleri]|nr:Zinc finger C2H2 protein [Dictyocoela muelleri]